MHRSVVHTPALCIANNRIISSFARTARDDQNNCSALITSLMATNVIIAKATFDGQLTGAIYFVSCFFFCYVHIHICVLLGA